jgi:hypothetical protein
MFGMQENGLSWNPGSARNTHPAFAGEFHLRPGNDHELRIEWRHGSEQACLEIDLKSMAGAITYSNPRRPAWGKWATIESKQQSGLWHAIPAQEIAAFSDFEIRVPLNGAQMGHPIQTL